MESEVKYGRFTLFSWLQSAMLWDGLISPNFGIDQGVPQGAVLSLLLYAVLAWIVEYYDFSKLSTSIML